MINSPLGGKWVNNKGFKTTVLRALLIMTAGVLLYALSSWMSLNYSSLEFALMGDKIPVGFVVFLLGSFMMGTSAAILQVVVNPYIAAYPLEGTQAVQRLNISFSFNSLATTIAPFFVTLVVFAGVPIERVNAGQVLIPFLLIALGVGIVTLLTKVLSLPDLDAIRETRTGTKSKQSIWKFRHFTFGVVAIFFYVGAEVSIGVNINLHAMEILNEGGAL